jgi:hypothetical protein
MSTALTTAQRAELGALLIARMATLEEEIAAQEGAGGRVAAAAELLDDSREGGVQREADREVALQRTSQAHGELQRVRDALPGWKTRASACAAPVAKPSACRACRPSPGPATASPASARWSWASRPRRACDPGRPPRR